ncbi:MAG: small ribosomal subunit Rsm22 family protein [Methanomicrobiales archaeon]|nr:small ribosomal subunit Rsm22 family protein [Methanomicrobiales archaeon]
MSRREILSLLTSMAREKPSFLASELKIRLGKDLKGVDLRRTLEPHLDTLGLRGEERGDDLLISRLPPAHPFVLRPDARETGEEFLFHPSIPDRLQELIESYIAKKTGKNWNDPVVLDRIRAAIRAQKGEYWDQAGGRPISYGAGYRVLAYLAYQAPVVLVQFEHILHEMAVDGLLKDRMRVLDIGSGPGTVPLAIIDTWSRLSPGEVRISALERETENLEAFRSIVPAFASRTPSVRIDEPIQEDLMSVDPDNLPREMDLIVFGTVLNELRKIPVETKAALVEKISGTLAGDGTVVIMEPADLENSLALRKLVTELSRRGMTLYAPCTHLWSTDCRPDRCWTFRDGPAISPPRLMSRLASSADGYRYRNTDIKFSYAILRKDHRTREAYRIPRGMKALRLSKLQGHLKRRVNVVVAKMSGDLGGRGNHVYKVCDGTPQKPVFAVVPDHHAGHARALLEARYGEILSLENTTVRYNPARDAFNLFIDLSSRIQRVGPQRGIGTSPGRDRLKKGRREKDGLRGRRATRLTPSRERSQGRTTRNGP